MATTKLTITMPEETLARLRSSAKKAHARSLSAYISEMVDKHEDEMTFAEYLDNFQPTPEQQAWANKALGISE